MGRVKSKVLQHDHQRLRIRSLPPPVGEYPIEKRTDGRATEVAEKSESAAHSESEGEERAPLRYVRGRRWSPGVYRSLRLLGRPLEVAWERAFITLPTF